MTTVYPTTATGAHGNSGDKSAGKDGFSREGVEMSKNKQKVSLRMRLGLRCRRFESGHSDQKSAENDVFRPTFC